MTPAFLHGLLVILEIKIGCLVPVLLIAKNVMIARLMRLTFLVRAASDEFILLFWSSTKDCFLNGPCCILKKIMESLPEFLS
jgi:hypothetical protein